MLELPGLSLDFLAPSVYRSKVYGFIAQYHIGRPEFSTGNLDADEEGKQEEEKCLLDTRTLPITQETLFAVGYTDDDFKRYGDEVWGVMALDPVTCTMKWSYRLPDGFLPDTLAVAYGLVYLQSEDRIEAVDTQIHQPRWSWQAEVALSHSFVADGTIYALASEGLITALDARTGEKQWEWQAQQPLRGILSTIDDATLYLVAHRTLMALS